jgi:hypothetical protein
MTSALAEQPAALPRGSQEPRVWTYPPAVGSSGDEIADFCAANGLVLDPWQRLALVTSMGEKPGGRWAAGEVAVIVPRQNGKGSILEAREIGGLYLLGEMNIIHTAQQFRTATDAFARILSVIEGSPDLNRRKKKVLNSPIEKSITLDTGAKIQFIARGPNSGRGLSKTDLLVFDEAYDLTDGELEALVPTMTAARDPQVWYTSSAGKEHSVVLAKIRQRGLNGSPTLAYMEWSIPQPKPDDPPPDVTDPVLLAQANPALGTRVTPEFLELERGSLSQAGLLRERLGVFDVVPSLGGVFLPGTWEACMDPNSSITGALTFGVDVAWDRSSASISACGAREDGVFHLETVENRPGTDWVGPVLVEKTRRNGGAVVIDPGSPAGSLIDDLRKQGVRIHEVTARDYAQACGWMYDSVKDREVRHLPEAELDSAVVGAQMRELAGGFAWDRKKQTSDITPLVAVTLACWGFRTFGGLDLAGAVW